jgi:hypothetical protein
MSMSKASRALAGVVLITVPTIAFGGVFLLGMVARHSPGYLDNPVRQALMRAGHAHAGVLVILTLVALLYVDDARLPERLRWLARLGIAAAPILMPLGFFLSVLSPSAQSPSPLVGLVYAGAGCLALGVLTLGIGLVRACID